jgi:TATA-box binding protein (TBP) (component of TFIID and TFIIIB)
MSIIHLEPESIFNTHISECTTDDKIASDLVVAVITLCGSLGSEINLIEIFEYYTIYGDDEYKLSYVPNSKKTDKVVKTKAFYNCLNVSFKFIDKNGILSNIAAKIFPNGSIQIPGCRTINAVHNTPDIVYEFIKKMDGKCKAIKPNIQIIKNYDSFRLINLKIVMINSNFTFCDKIFQEILKDIINIKKYDGQKDDNIWRMANFQPEKYSGINIRYLTENCRKNINQAFNNGDKIPMKLNGQVSIFIFRSGKGTITGAKNTDDLKEAYEAITNIVRINKKEVFIKENIPHAEIVEIDKEKTLHNK